MNICDTDPKAGQLADCDVVGQAEEVTESLAKGD
jgi:hypothetical protein